MEKAGFEVCEWSTYSELAEYASPLLHDNEWACAVIDMLCDRFESVDLNNCISDEHWECQWCNRVIFNTESKVEVDMGFMCDSCIRAIESRGEKLHFLDDEVY